LPLTENAWIYGMLNSYRYEQWFFFNVTEGTKYYVWLEGQVFSQPGIGNSFDYYGLDGYYNDRSGPLIFEGSDPRPNFTASQSGTVFVKVYPYGYDPGTGSKEWDAGGEVLGNFRVGYTTTDNEPNRTPVSIAITTPPSKTTYIMGETLDPRGMVVMVNYSDGSSGTADSYSFDYDAPMLPGTRTVTVSYSEGFYSGGGDTLTTTFTITVTMGDLSDTVLSEGIWTNGSLTLSTIDYYSTYGQWFSFPVIQGQEYYIWRIEPPGTYTYLDLYYGGDSWTAVQDETDYYHEYSLGYTFTAAQNGTVYIKAGSSEAAVFQISYTITGNRPNGGNKRVASISVTPPSQRYYRVNESLNLDGMVVTVYYTDNSQTDVSNSSGVTVNTYDYMSTPGTKYIRAAYSDEFGSASANFGFSIEVYETPIYRIELNYYLFNNSFPNAIEGYGAQTPLTVTVSNTGNQPTGNLAVVLGGASPGSFILSTASIGSIAADNTGSFTVGPNTGLEVGTHTVTVTVSGGNGISESFTVSFQVVAKSPASIGVSTLPTKTSYVVGETFNPAGMVITASYNDGSQGAVTDYTLSSPGMSTAGTKTVTVSYTKGGVTKNATFQITVAAYDYDISLKNNGSVLTSYSFQAAAGYGAQTPLTVTVSNTGNQPTGNLAVVLGGASPGSFTLSAASIGSIAAGNAGSFTVGPNTGLGIGTYTATVTVSGGNGISESFTVSFWVTVKSLTGIEVTTPPTKTSYVVGETFNPAGLIVKANYNNGNQTAVTGYSLSSPGMSTAGTKTVTVSYTEGSVTKTTTFQITVVVKALTGIAITTAPTKTSYIVGEALDTAGMVVTASYNDSNTAAVSTYTTSGFDSSAVTAGQTVTVSYTEGGITKTATFTVTIALPTNGAAVTLYWVEEGKLAFSNGASDTVSRTGSLIISAQGTGYTGQRWFINGAEDAAAAGQSSYTFSGVNKEVGKKNVIGLRTVKNNVPYYAELTVTVTTE
jgi:hypothetical protein